MSKRIKVAVNPFGGRLVGPLGWAYAAGLFDGEGCVHIARQRKATARRGYIYRLTVSIAHNHLDTLKDFQDLTGIEGRIYRRPRQGSANRDGYALNYDGDDAADLLEILHPFLCRKADEATVALHFQRECEVNRHFGPQGCPADIWKKRERLYRKLRNLK